MTLAVAFATGFAAGATQDVPPPPPSEIARTESYCEGPVFDYEGNLFVSHGNTVSKIAPDGTRSVWLTTRAPNGHKILPDGTHLLCAAGAVLRISADGVMLGEAASSWNGNPLRAPNDLTLDGHGGFYFTDPGGSRREPIGSVYHVDAAGSIERVAGGMSVPNGLVLSLERRRLYVAETVPNRVVWFEVRDSRRWGPLNVLAVLPGLGEVDGPDGLALDAAGNIYVAQLTSGKVLVLSPDGELLHTLDAGNSDASNLAWGGANLNELYVTGSIGHRTRGAGRVFRLELAGVRGVSTLLPRTRH